MVQSVKHFYVYITLDSKDNRLYIGRRVCNCEPKVDSYMGSHTDPFYEPDFKKILRICETAEEAAVWEWFLHEVFDVGRNPRFANRAKARIKNFCISGMRWWTNGEEDFFDYAAPSAEFSKGRSKISGDRHPNKSVEAREAARERMTGEKNPGFGKTGDLNVARRPEVRKKLSESSRGSRNPMFGKVVSEDRRKRTSDTMKKLCEGKDMGGQNHPCYGLKWWTNGEIEKKSKECPEGWYRGRKPKKGKI
jgi:hypothetical protein